MSFDYGLPETGLPYSFQLAPFNNAHHHDELYQPSNVDAPQRKGRAYLFRPFKDTGKSSQKIHLKDNSEVDSWVSSIVTIIPLSSSGNGCTVRSRHSFAQQENLQDETKTLTTQGRPRDILTELTENNMLDVATILRWGALYMLADDEIGGGRSVSRLPPGILAGMLG